MLSFYDVKTCQSSCLSQHTYPGLLGTNVSCQYLNIFLAPHVLLRSEVQGCLLAVLLSMLSNTIADRHLSTNLENRTLMQQEGRKALFIAGELEIVMQSQ